MHPDEASGSADARPDAPARRLSWRKLACFALLLGLLAGGGWLITRLENGIGPISGEAVAAYVKSWGVWGHFALIGLMIAHSFVPFPAEFVALAAGMCFGWLWGAVLTWLGAMAGGLLAFALSRRFGRPFVADVLAPRQMARIDGWSNATSISALLAVRLIPVIAFNLINYAAGLTRVSWWRFTWTMGLGILPMTVLMTVLGDQMREPTLTDWLLLAAAGLAIIAVTYAAQRLGLGKRRS